VGHVDVYSIYEIEGRWNLKGRKWGELSSVLQSCVSAEAIAYHADDRTKSGGFAGGEKQGEKQLWPACTGMAADGEGGDKHVASYPPNSARLPMDRCVRLCAPRVLSIAGHDCTAINLHPACCTSLTQQAHAVSVMAIA
jgi:hypothetical protein